MSKIKKRLLSLFLIPTLLIGLSPTTQLWADEEAQSPNKELYRLSNPKERQFDGDIEEFLKQKTDTKEESLEKSEVYYREAVAEDAIRKNQTGLEDSVVGKYSSSQYDLSEEEQEEMKKLLNNSRNVRPGVDHRSSEFKEEDEANNDANKDSYREVIEYKPKDVERNEAFFRPSYTEPTQATQDFDGSAPSSGDWTKYEQEVKAEHSKAEAVNYLWSLEGTVYSQSQRMAPGMYDCSSMVDRVVAYYLGTPPNGMTTFTMPGDSRFYQVSMAEIQPYDILWTNGHVEFYVGGNDTFGAHCWGIPNGLSRGNFSYTPWLRVYRVKGW